MKIRFVNTSKEVTIPSFIEGTKKSIIYDSNPITTNTIFNRFFYFRSEEIPRNDITYTDSEWNTTTIETCRGMSGLMTQDRYIEYMNEAFRNNKISIQWTKG